MKNSLKIAAITIFLILANSFIFAQNLSLNDVAEQLSKHPNTTGNFEQIKTIKNSSRNLKSSGNFIFSLEGIMWQTLKPFPSTLAIGKDFVIQTSADGTKTVTDTSQNQIFTTIAEIIISVFSNDFEMLQNSFNTEFFADENSNWTLTLLPKDSTISAVLKSLVLSGKSDGTNSTIESILMTEASENSIRYNFSNLKYPKELSADEKAFFKAD